MNISYTPENYDTIVELMIEMYEETAEENKPPYTMDVEHLRKSLPILYDTVPEFILHFTQNGFILGFVIRHPLWPTMVIASEEAFYVRKSARGGRLGYKLLTQFENTAKERGANFVTVTNSSGINSEAVHRFYKHFGYSPKGGIFGKEL